METNARPTWLYLKMLVLVTAIDVTNFMLISKSAQFA